MDVITTALTCRVAESVQTFLCSAGRKVQTMKEFLARLGKTHSFMFSRRSAGKRLPRRELWAGKLRVAAIGEVKSSKFTI